MRANGSLLHYFAQSELSEGSFGLGLDYGPSAAYRGFQLSLEPVWNDPFSSQSSSMWSSEAGFDESVQVASGAALKVRVARGVAAMRDLALLTPYGEVKSGQYDCHLRLGMDIRPGGNAHGRF